MFEKLKKIKQRHQELSEMLSDPDIFKDQSSFRKLAKEQNDLTTIVEKYAEYEKISKQLSDTNELMKNEQDKELIELAEIEIADLNDRIEEIEQNLKILLIPKDPEDERNAIMEIRAGTGGN